MTLIVEVDRIVDPIDKINSVTIEKISDVQGSFLQMPVRQKGGEHRFDLTPGYFVAPNLRVMKFVAHRADVIKDLPPAFREVFRQRRIYFRKVLVKPVKFDIDFFFRPGKKACR